MELSTKNLSTLKVVLYSLSIGIGTSGASVWVFKRISILMMSLKGRIFEWLKCVLHTFQMVNFLGNWHTDKHFLSLTVRKSSNFTQTLIWYASKLQILPKYMYRFSSSWVIKTLNLGMTSCCCHLRLRKVGNHERH